MLECEADNSLIAQTNPPLIFSRITFIALFVKVVLQARGVVLSRAKRFLPLGKNNILPRKRSYAAKGSIIISVFFFSVHFSFCVAIKKKSEQREILFLKHIPIICFM